MRLPAAGRDGHDRPHGGGTIMRTPFGTLLVAAMIAAAPATADAQPAQKWVTSWAASVQGPYPIGNPSAQPDQRFAFPVPEAGARDQTFRLIVRPDAWGK